MTQTSGTTKTIYRQSIVGGRVVRTAVELPLTGREKVRNPTVIAKLAAGVVGAAKATVGVDRASPETIAARLAICTACELARPCISLGGKLCCGRLLDVLKPTAVACGCVIESKIKLRGQSCPLSPPKWGPVPAPPKAV